MRILEISRDFQVFLSSQNFLKDARKDDLVSIYADLTNGKCLKGSDASLFVKNHSDKVQFIGNGLLEVDRDDVFKTQLAKKYAKRLSLPSFSENLTQNSNSSQAGSVSELCSSLATTIFRRLTSSTKGSTIRRIYHP